MLQDARSVLLVAQILTPLSKKMSVVLINTLLARQWSRSAASQWWM